MKESKHILALIYQFLIRKEQRDEKKEILDWYENYNLDYEPTQEHIMRTGASVKEQVLHSMQQSQVLKRRRLWYPLAAAIAIFLLAGSVYLLLDRDSSNKVADTGLLASINPADPQARITLESGEVIDLEKMSIDSCIKLDHIEIRKDSTGQITYVQNSHSTSAGSNTIETPSNANYTLNLSDGTVVMLNANTKLKYPNSFGDGDRTVQLEGEAYFIVAKTKKQQRFFVKTSQQITEVLGTRFNVKARKDKNNEQITLEEGAIRISSTSTSEKQTMRPGQQAIIRNAQMKIEQVDLDPFLTWTKGYFYLDGQNTSEVLQEIAEWYNIDIDYSNNRSRNIYKGKIPKKLPLDKLLQLLEYTDLKAKPTVQNDRVKLLIN